mgnify:CR=1 FL=1
MSFGDRAFLWLKMLPPFSYDYWNKLGWRFCPGTLSLFLDMGLKPSAVQPNNFMLLGTSLFATWGLLLLSCCSTESLELADETTEMMGRTELSSCLFAF